MKFQVGKGTATLQYLLVLAVSLHCLTECPRFPSDADLLSCPFYTKETEAQRLMLRGLCGKGFQPVFSLPTQPLHLTHCHLPLGSWCQAGCQVRGGSAQKPQLINSSFPILSRQEEKSGLATLGTHPIKWLLKVLWTPQWPHWWTNKVSLGKLHNLGLQ